MSCCGVHLGFPIGIKSRNLAKDIPMISHLQFGFVSSLVSEKKIFEISANQSILLALATILNIRLERKIETL
jgi:energy-converting hydrogenase Eha subunit C